MKLGKRILSFFVSLVMLLTNTVPAFAAGEDGAHQTTVVVHKMKMESLTDFPKIPQDGKSVGVDGKTEYNGQKIEDIEGYFGDGAEELAGVIFDYYTINKEQYSTFIANPQNFDTKDKVNEALGEAGSPTGSFTTTSDGVEVTLPDGYYWFVEDSFVDPNGETLSGAAAVPFGLELPMTMADGTDFDTENKLHVYPKNTLSRTPKTDKDFVGNANANGERLEVDNNIVETHTVGDEIPYEIETLIPANAQYKTSAWTDQMTEGLTFNNDVKVFIGAKGSETELDAGDYEVTEDGNGFVLELTSSGLAKINGQENETRVYITYSATLNGKAVVEREERNDMIFHYGNNPTHGNTPYPTKPNDEGKLKVTKDFPNVIGRWEVGESVEVTLYDAHTGKVVTFDDGQSATVTLTIDKQTHEWTGLDKDRQYKVVEKFTPGDQVTYEKGDNGQIIIHDEKTDNPNPINPQEPAVVTYGHRFQKVDQEGAGLAGAKFVITNEDGSKVLAKKTETEIDQDQATYDAAEKAYKDAVNAGEAINDTIVQLKKARDDAYKAVNIEYKWIEKTDDYQGAYVVTSANNGFFKVTGLKDGSYKLVETEAPSGFAKLTDPVTFTVGQTSMDETTKLETGLEDAGLSKVTNKKVTIPQTGGIGTLVFTVAGLAMMSLAFVAMRRNKENLEA